MKPFNSIKRLLGRAQEAPALIFGFRHANGVGIRSKNYVMPLSRGASGFARALAADAELTLIENNTESTDAKSLSHLATTFLPQLGQHRHTSSIFLIALGDETVSAQEIAAQIQALGTACEYLVINDCVDMEMATTLALGTAQELKSMALSGIDTIDRCDLTIAYQEEPACMAELLTQLEEKKFAVRVHQMSALKNGEMVALAMSGSHAILSFEAEDQYPSGTLVTPVINVATDSEFHRAIATEFDLGHDSSVADIVQKVEQIVGMMPTISEVLGTYEPLFASNLPSLNDVADENEVCLIPTNPVVIPFLIDLVSHQSGFFLKDWENFIGQDVPAKKIILIGTGGGADEVSASVGNDARIKSLNISEFGSLHGLAAAILAEA
jgi:hypothetical protein